MIIRNQTTNKRIKSNVNVIFPKAFFTNYCLASIYFYKEIVISLLVNHEFGVIRGVSGTSSRPY